MSTSISPCCLRGFTWSGTPTGTITTTLPGSSPPTPFQAYKTGTNPYRAVLLVHDLFGWTFPNIRLLADHYAREADATVYVPDFFGGLVIDAELIAAESWAQIDMAGFHRDNNREVREPEILEWARGLRREGFERVGAVGFCFGGWAVFRLGAEEHEREEGGGKKLVDCIVAGHPTWLTEGDVDGLSVNVPVQVLAPEIDEVFNKELKWYTFGKLQERGVPFEWVHFPGVKHACLTRGDEGQKGEREAMVRGKDAAVGWLKQWLA